MCCGRGASVYTPAPGPAPSVRYAARHAERSLTPSQSRSPPRRVPLTRVYIIFAILYVDNLKSEAPKNRQLYEKQFQQLDNFMKNSSKKSTTLWKNVLNNRQLHERLHPLHRRCRIQGLQFLSQGDAMFTCSHNCSKQMHNHRQPPRILHHLLTKTPTWQH